MKDDDRTAAPDDPQQKASDRVGVGGGPVSPPASGTGPRPPGTSAPPTGRFDEARATHGAEIGPGDALPIDVAGGAGDEPTDGPAAHGEPGVDESASP